MGKLNKLAGLWPAKSGKGYSGGLREPLELPAGARLVLVKIPEAERRERGPHLELLWSPPPAATASPDPGERAAGPRPPTDAELGWAARTQAPPGWRPGGTGRG